MIKPVAVSVASVWLGSMLTFAYLQPKSRSEVALDAQRQAETRYVEGVIYGARMATLKCYPTYTGKR